MKREPIEENLPKVNVKTPMPKVKPPKNRVELERDDYYENLKIADKKIIDLERKLKIAEEALESNLSDAQEALVMIEYENVCDRRLSAIVTGTIEAMSAIREE